MQHARRALICWWLGNIKGPHLHGLVHLFECLFGLLKEVIDDGVTELMVVRLVHLKDLTEGGEVDYIGLAFEDILGLLSLACGKKTQPS